jgi:hypothetical protein
VNQLVLGKMLVICFGHHLQFCRILSLLKQIKRHFLALHLRRSQENLPSEMAGWSNGSCPDVRLAMEEIIPIVAHALENCPLCDRKVFLATNSKNVSKIQMLMKR